MSTATAPVATPPATGAFPAYPTTAASFGAAAGMYGATPAMIPPTVPAAVPGAYSYSYDYGISQVIVYYFIHYDLYYFFSCFHIFSEHSKRSVCSEL